MPSLIARLLQATQKDNPAEVKVPPDAGARWPLVTLGAGTPGRNRLTGDGVFSCGRPGHGVKRCSRVDTFFSFQQRGWSVDIQDAQYRAVWPGGSMARSPSGNEGWSGREGQPPGSSVTQERLTPVEGSVFPRSPGANRYGGHRWGMCMVPVGLLAHKLFHHWGAIHQCFPERYTNGITEGCRPWLSRSWVRGIGLFRSGWAGGRHRWSPQCLELGDLGGGCGMQGGIADRSPKKLSGDYVAIDG